MPAPLNLEPSDTDKAYEQSVKAADNAPAEATNSEPDSKPIDSGAGEKTVVETKEPVVAEPKKTAEPVKAEEKPVEKQAPRAKVPAPKLVPVGAMLEERHQRQAYERDIESLKRELETLKNPPKAAPDQNLDPDGYTRWRMDQLEQKVTSATTETEAQKKVSEMQAAYARRFEDAKTYESASLDEFYKARKQDYDVYKDAHLHYRNIMRAILPRHGIKDPAAIEYTITDMLLRAIEDAKASGENAAERIFDLATEIGFKATPLKPIVSEAANDTQKDEGIIQQVNDKLSIIADGQKASKTVASSGKSSGGLTLNELLATAKGASLLEETELDKVSKRQAKRLFGE